MNEWETYTPRPDKPDYHVVIDGQSVPLYRDEDGFLRPRDRYLTAHEADVLIALGKTVRPRTRDTDAEIDMLRSENRYLRTEVAKQSRDHWMLLEEYNTRILQASLAIDCDSDPLDIERRRTSGWKAATIALAFMVGATTMARMLGWLP